MEEYRNSAGRFFVPSLFMLISTSAVIILSYSSVLDGYCRGFGIVLIILSGMSFPFVYRHSMKIAPGDERRILGSAVARIASLIFMTLLLSLVLFVRIRAYGREEPLLPRSTYIGTVEEVIDRRYDREILMRFRKGGTDPVGSSGEAAWRRGIVYTAGSVDLDAGDVVTFSGKPVLIEPAGTSSPAHRSLLCRGIRYIWYLETDALSIIHSSLTWKKQARSWLSRNCDALFSKKTATVVKALYFGNQNAIDKRIMNDFKRAGVLHILSASGQHVGIVAAIPLFLLGLIRLNRKCILAATGLVIAFYLYITDMPVSLLRASIMFFLYALQRIADREVNIINTLFISAIIVLMIFPHEIYSLGFQLSFGATLGILLFFKLYKRVFSYLPSFLSGSLALSISAQLLIIPVLLIRVGELNLSGVISNIIVVPAMSLLLIVSIAANGLSILTCHAAYLGSTADAIFGLNQLIVEFISDLNCHFNVSSVHPILFCAYVMLMLPLIPLSAGKRIMSLPIVVAFAVAWLYLGVAGTPEQNASIITHERGSALLVRDGRAVSVIGNLPGRDGINLVTQEMGKNAYREIFLFIPQPDRGNIYGYSFLAKRFPVRRCYISDQFRIRSDIKRFFIILDRDGVDLVLYDFNSCSGAAAQPDASGYIRERVCALYRKLAVR